MASTEIYNDIYLKVAKSLDAKLAPVANVEALLDPTDPTNFLYEGATVWVISEDRPYTVKLINNVLVWKPSYKNDKVLGVINLLSSSTHLDLSGTQPAIDNCWGVVINIVGSGTPILSTIANLPLGENITLFVEPNKSLIVKHKDIDLAQGDDIVLELGSDITLKGRTIGTERLILFNDNGVNTQYGSVQFVDTDELVALVTQALTTPIANNLTTNSSTTALSAAMGVYLAQLINAKNPRIIPGIGLTKSYNAVNDLDTFSLNVPYYTKTIPSSAVGNINTYLTTRSNSDTHNLVVDLTAFKQGSYLLPRGAAANVLVNWITLIEPINTAEASILNYFKATQIFSNSDQVYIPVGREDIYNLQPTTVLDLTVDAQIGSRFVVDGRTIADNNPNENLIRCVIKLKLPMGLEGSLNPYTLGRTWLESKATINETINLSYGNLYNSYTLDVLINDPLGWRLPTIAELIGLPANLKTASDTDWGVSNTSTNASGFSALPNGLRNTDGTFTGFGTIGTWWSSDFDGSNRSALRLIAGDNSKTTVNLDPKTGASVRLVREAALWEKTRYAEGEVIPKVYLDASGNYYDGVLINGSQVWITSDLKTNIASITNDEIPNITDNTAWGALTTLAYATYNNAALETTFYTIVKSLYNKNSKLGFTINHLITVQSTQLEVLRATESVNENTRGLTVTFSGVFKSNELFGGPFNSMYLNFINTTDLPVYGGATASTAQGVSIIQEFGFLEVILEELS